jgi:hypothetical protein
MGGNGQSCRGAFLVLLLIVILSPTIIESETFGVGEGMILDVVHLQTRFEGVCYAIEWNSSRTLTPHPDTFKLLLPYITPITLLVSIFGALSPIISWLVMTKRISFQNGLLIIILSSLILLFAPSVNILRVEHLYTYRMRPLLVPQIASSLVLIWHYKHRIYGLAK